MTERSRFWDNDSPGDASESPYDAATKFAQVMRSVSGSGARASEGGVFFGELGDLEVTTGGTSPVTVATGRGIVYGNWYENDDPIDIAIPNAPATIRADRIVVQKDWNTQEVRAVRLAGTNGSATPPALTQTIGDIWEIPLAKVDVAGGALTITDERETGSILGSTTPTKIKFDVAGTQGSDPSAARATHVHEIDDPATPTALVFGGAAAVGVGLDPAREDHAHEMPKLFAKYQVADGAIALSFPVLAGETYIVHGVVFYDTGTDDLTLSFTVPGGSTMRWGAIGPDASILTTVIEQQVASNGGLVFGAEATDHGVHYQGSLTVGADGTVALATAGAGLDIKKFSTLFATKVN